MKFYEALKAATPKLEAEFNMSQIIQHSPSKGALREYILNSIIRPFLPKRYGLTNSECFDATGKTSKQLDITIYDDLFSYAIPYGDYKLLPFESVYGVIEVKSLLNKESFFEGIDNIASLKSLSREPAGKCQVLPNLEIDIAGIEWNFNGYTKAFGVVFAYDSVTPETVISYFHDLSPLNPSLMPDMIVLFKKKTIIARIQYFEDEKFYVTTGNTYQGFLILPCDEDTLPIFLAYILCRTNDTRIKIADISGILNSRIDERLHAMGEQKVVKFTYEHVEDN